METRLAQSYPFREVKEKLIDSFLFKTELNESSQSRRALAISPDAKYPGMWRIKLPNGLLSDMVNLTRAKDAAVSLGRAASQIANCAHNA